MSVPMRPILRDHLYSSGEAASILPGRGGKPMSPASVVLLIKKQALKGRQIGSQWFVMGEDLQRYRDGAPAEEMAGATR